MIYSQRGKGIRCSYEEITS